MIYKKIENFPLDIRDNYDVWVAVPIVTIWILLSPIWFPFWLISKFWNTPKI